MRGISFWLNWTAEEEEEEEAVSPSSPARAVDGGLEGDYNIFSMTLKKGIKNYLCRADE